MKAPFGHPKGYGLNRKILESTNYGEFKSRLTESACDICPALVPGRTHIVVDRGNPAARLVLVGEAPGAREDATGTAFVGRAGKVLDAALAEGGIDPSDVLILNTLKCRPPRNRRPTIEELACCRPFFEKQLSFLRPRVVGLLGATALRAFSPDNVVGPMGDSVGKFFTVLFLPGVPILTLYHPAALLYNPRLRPAMGEHIRLLKEVLISGFSLGGG
jgi:DNA polymerase